MVYHILYVLLQHYDCEHTLFTTDSYSVFTLYLSVLGDAGSFLVQLSKGLKGHRCLEEWPQSLKAGDMTKENANRYSKQT